MSTIFWKYASLWITLFRAKRITAQGIKGRNYFPLPIFLIFFLSSSFPNPNLRIFTRTKLMGVKCSLRSSSSKVTKLLTSKTNRPLLGGEEKLSTVEQWIIPSLFEDYMFDKSLDWGPFPCFANPSYTACRELDDLLIMDLEVKHVPRLSTCKGDFAPTIDVVFKSHTSVSKGWRCQRALIHPPFMDIL